MSLDLSIIILNYNTRDWVVNCLAKMETFSIKGLRVEVIVVDNQSDDDSVQIIQEKFPDIKVIESGENGGFAKGNNIGIRAARGRYVMLLNSDTEFTSQTDLASMVKYLDTHPDVGVMTPYLQLASGGIDPASHRGEPTPWAALTYFSHLEKLFSTSRVFGQYHQTWKSLDEIHAIDACSGAAMLVRSSVLSTVGLLDEDFFMYAEDLDWCRRFRDAGYQVVFFPKSVIIHHKYKSGRGKMENGERRTEKILPNSQSPILKRLTSHLPAVATALQAGNPSPTTNLAEFHFWQTMTQYYQKHYALSHPIFTWCVCLGIDVMQKIRRRPVG